MNKSTYRDKDFLVTNCGVIFEVIGYSHGESSVTAFPRYIPFEVVPIRQWGHTWRMLGGDYSRFDIRVTTTQEIRDIYARFLDAFPQFLSGYDEVLGFVQVPHAVIRDHVRPSASLARLRAVASPDPLQAAARKLADECGRIGIPDERIGVSYSLMFDGHTVGFSDVDFVVFDAEPYRRVLEHLTAKQPPMVQYPSVEDWAKRYEGYGIRDMPLSPTVYAHHKIRRAEEGFIDGHKLSIFAVRLNDAQKAVQQPCIRIGPLRIRGRVIDASQAVFRPSIYLVEVDDTIPDVYPSGSHVTIVNYRREYVSQARHGERIDAYGLAGRGRDGETVLELGSLELRGEDFLVVEGLGSQSESCG